MDSSPQNKVLMALGELTGEVKGIQRQIENGNSAINQRFDDMKDALEASQSATNARLDKLEQRMDKFEERNIAQLVRNASWGGVGGAAIAALLEILKVIKG